MQRFNGVAVMLAATIVAVAIAACGGSGSHTPAPPRKGSDHHHPAKTPTVDFYSSLPLTGSDATEGRAIKRGIVLALSQADHRAGDYQVRYVAAMNDAGTNSAASAALAYSNARRAALDPAAVFYIGDYSSLDSAQSIPVLNLADIAQMDPGGTYLGFTQSVPHATTPNEPGKYYPAGRRTFLRLVPSDAVQAAAQLTALQGVKCTKLAVVYEGQLTGPSLAILLAQEAKSYGIALPSNLVANPSQIGSTASAISKYAAELQSEGIECLAIAGRAATPAVHLAEAVHALLPTATIIASDGLCRAAFTASGKGGIAAATAAMTLCTQPISGPKGYPDWNKFSASYKARYGVSPTNPWALYGYVAARLGLAAVTNLGTDGGDRAAVVRWLFSIRGMPTAIGTLGFDASGDTTLDSYGLYKVAANGDPGFYQTVTPTKGLASTAELDGCYLGRGRPCTG